MMKNENHSVSLGESPEKLPLDSFFILIYIIGDNDI
jgi:hypothetical protein